MKRTLAILCLLSPAAIARADWPSDASVDVPVANIDNSGYPSVVADSQGGVFVIFSHADSTPSVTLRGQHFSSAADRLWGTETGDAGFEGIDLLGLSLGTGASAKATAVPTLDGGFIAAYTSGGTSGPWTLNLQRFDAEATSEWAATGAFGGVQLLATPTYYDAFDIVPDSLGGALAIYGGSSGWVGQRVDDTGASDYGASGYLFANSQYPGPFYPDRFISPDGLGGMYFIWPNSGSESSDPLIDYLKSTGALGFQVGSVAPLTTPFEQWAISGLPDGAGVWAGWWAAAGTAVVLQEFLPDAGALFDGGAQNGFDVASLSTVQNPMITLLGDGSGGVTVIWFASVSGTGGIYAQHYASDGGALWGANPVLVSGAASQPVSQSTYLAEFRAFSGANGNPTIIWIATPRGLFAEQLDLASGARQWGLTTGGTELSTVDYPAWIDVALASDDGTYVAYQDSLEHVYVKRIGPDGTLGGTSPADAGTGTDAGSDAGVDAGNEQDGGTDGGEKTDGGADGGVDGGTDGGFDAGGIDAGGVVDAGPKGDAGGLSTPDAGPPPDAGSGKTSSSGCGCTSSSAGEPWSFGLVLFLGFAVARRARRVRELW